MKSVGESPRGRSRLAFGARVACSLALLAWVLWQVDLGSLRHVMAGTSPLGILAGCIAMLASIATAGVGWFLVFPSDHRPVRLVDAVRYTVVGASFNALLPTSGIAGDLYRGWACHRNGGSPALSAYVVLAARWCGLAALGCSLWIAYGSLAARPVFAGLPLTKLSLALAIGVTGLTVLLALLLLAPSSPFLGFISRKGLVGVTVSEVSAFLAAFVRTPRQMLLTLLVGIVAVYLEGLGIYFVACAAGAPPNAILFLLVGPAVRMIHQVPGFFNAIGLQEAAVIAAGDTMGVHVGVTLAISLLLHGVRIGIAVLGLFWYAAGPTAAREAEQVSCVTR